MTEIEKDIIKLDEEIQKRKLSLSQRSESQKRDAELFYEDMLDRAKKDVEKNRLERLDKLDHEIIELQRSKTEDYLKHRTLFLEKFSPKSSAERIAVSIYDAMCRRI